MSSSTKRRPLRLLLRLLLAIFILMNVSAIMHAYHFTHFSSSNDTRTKNPEAMRFTEKLSALFFGASLPRPVNQGVPPIPYESFRIDDKLSCWRIPGDSNKETIMLFHGYGNRKSGMLDRALALNDLGYTTVLMDFEGGGDSEGNTCTIGYNEADQVKRCYDVIQEQVPADKIVLLGSSMGAAAITRCLSVYQNVQPKAVVLECPFGSLLDAAGNRFDAIGLPRFPLVHMLIFYGGLMHGFWAFGYQPSAYAADIKTPCLLLTGGKDERVKPEETTAIFNHLAGAKQHIIYPEARHESYLNHYASEWKHDVDQFIRQH